MRGLIEFVVPGILLLTLPAAFAKPNPSPADSHDPVVIVYKDGHRQSLAMAEIARIDVKSAAIVYKDGHREKLSSEIDRIEFGSPADTMMPSRAHFIGKWEVGEGSGGGKFFITLEADGDAKKTLGSSHGTWTLVDGEARITWDDGWHDALRKVGGKYEKRAFEPGKTFEDAPSNVTAAMRTDHKPI